ncbi:MAG TPA: cupredoxin domain-containing protein [Dehalococcoidia bacterium]|nr:cupredoxin domain-containing protein [Dehalococcoidia bacterium]
MPNEQSSVWIRLLAGALAVVVLSFIVSQIASGEVIPPLLIQAVIFTALAYAVWRWQRRRWVLIVAIVLTVLGLAGGIPFMVEDLAHPESAWVFVPSSVVIIGLLVAIVSGGAALFRRSEAIARPLAIGAGALAVVLVVVGVVATLGVSDDARADGDTVIVAKKASYPSTVTVRAGDVGLYIENKDLIRHTFVIETADVKVELPGSASRHLAVALKPGAYDFRCDVPGHDSMKGTLEVK